MSLKCEHCQKGINYGHAVSHAKNRLHRLFKPNLQKLRVVKNGILTQVKLCTSCIKRLKKDGQIGVYKLRQIIQVEKTDKMPKVKVELSPKIVSKKVEKEVKAKEQKVKKETKETKARKTLDIEAIVGKKS